MDVTRRYYEGVDDFVRALGRNAHRRRHLPFWNLALGALASTEAAANQTSSSPALTAIMSTNLGGSATTGIQTAIGDVHEPVGAFSRAIASSNGRVLYVTYHTSPNSHVAPMNTYTLLNEAPPEDVLVGSAILTNSLIVIFCADDTLDSLFASWIYAEIASAHRNRSNLTPSSSAQSPTITRTAKFPLDEKPIAKGYSSLPPNIKPLRFNHHVTLYGSFAHVRALLDLASNAANDPKLQSPTSDIFGSKRFVPSDYRMSRDDSGMRVLGNRAWRASVRPQACEFAFGPSLFKRRTRNAYRMFFIATERLEAIDKVYAEAATQALIGATPSSSQPLPVYDTSKLIIDAAKCMRLATTSDWDELRAILRSETPDADAEDENDFDSILESLQKGNVYIWESARQTKSGKPGKPKLRCFAVLEFHSRPLPELSCVEIIDLHVSNPSRDTDTARMLTESLSRKFLTTTVAAPAPYHFLFVKVDVSVPDSSDQFLLDCGFVADSIADFVTLEISTSRERLPSGLFQPQNPFEITRVVKVSPLTEKPFSAYEIRVLETNELVRKRYREFDKLYFQLKAQLAGTNVPKLPKKKFFGNMDESFVEKRRLQLQTWLNTVARLPGVEESGWVSNFLWTDLKIRGVKPLSEVERFQRTLQRQAEEARQTAVMSANASISTQKSSASLAWPNRSPNDTKPIPSSGATHASSSGTPPASNSASSSPSMPSISKSVTSPSTAEIPKPAGKSKHHKEKKDKKNRRLSQ